MSILWTENKYLQKIAETSMEEYRRVIPREVENRSVYNLAKDEAFLRSLPTEDMVARSKVNSDKASRTPSRREFLEDVANDRKHEDRETLRSIKAGSIGLGAVSGAVPAAMGLASSIRSPGAWKKGLAVGSVLGPVVGGASYLMLGSAARKQREEFLAKDSPMHSFRNKYVHSPLHEGIDRDTFRLSELAEREKNPRLFK